MILLGVLAVVALIAWLVLIGVANVTVWFVHALLLVALVCAAIWLFRYITAGGPAV